MLENDSLVDVPIEKWPELRDILRSNGTISVPHYHTLDVNINYPGIRNGFKFKLYSPYGDTSMGLVCFSIKRDMEFVMMPMSDDVENLEKAILSSKRIDWEKKTCVDLLCPRSVEVLKRLRKELGLSHMNIMPITTFFYERSRNPFPDIRVPENTYIKKVRNEDVAQVNNAWPYKYPGSQNYFSTLVAGGLSYGLYSSTDHSLAAWVFLNEYGFICNLFCEEPYRRFGYARFLIQNFVNEKLKKGQDSYAFVSEGNDKSLKLFEKLGFQMIEDYNWAFVQK